MPPKRSRGEEQKQGLRITLDQALQREVLGVLLIAAGGVTCLGLLLGTRGALSGAWVALLRRIFGWGIYLIAPTSIGVGLLVLWEGLRTRLWIPPRSLFGLEILFLALLSLSHMPPSPQQAFQLAEKGGGGGYVGWAVSYALIAAVGRGGAFLVLLLIAGAGLALGLSALGDDLRAIVGDAKARLEELSQKAQSMELPPVSARSKERQRRPRKQAQASEPEEVVEPAQPQRGRRRRDRGLPPLDLLEGGGTESYDDADTRYRAQVIEETLASFGVPATVIQVNQGPTVTQFGVEPGFLEYPGQDGKARRRKVRVSKIMALQDDLALALAAAPIRIEAPVPGQSVVGIEVPNAKSALVSLRGVIESKAFRGMDSKLRIALGQDVAGQPVVANLAQMPHLLIAGATGSGKSVCVNAITACLLLDNTPDDLHLLMVDPKMVELTNFNGVPHLLAPVITSVEEAVRALRWVTMQMDDRYKLFSRLGVRNIEVHNQLMASRGEEKLPSIVVLIDELADLMMAAPDDIERSICRIAQLARATGIHLVIATQRPSVDVVTGLIKANIPARISFAVTSQVDSRVILDAGGAEKLLGRGDMLYMSPDSSKLVRLQGCFVSDAELDRLVRFWRERIDWIVPEGQAPAPWHGLSSEGDDADELLDQAIDLARGRESISTSFVQRRLRIGYPRAAHLIDLLEEQGIVGPAENAGRSRQVLDHADESENQPKGEDQVLQ